MQVNDFVCLSDRAYFHEQILVMEKIILGKLEWTLTLPTPYVFLVRFIKASIPDQEVSDFLHFCFFIKLSGSLFIGALLYLNCIVGKHGSFSC